MKQQQQQRQRQKRQKKKSLPSTTVIFTTLQVLLVVALMIPNNNVCYAFSIITGSERGSGSSRSTSIKAPILKYNNKKDSPSSSICSRPMVATSSSSSCSSLEELTLPSSSTTFDDDDDNNYNNNDNNNNSNNSNNNKWFPTRIQDVMNYNNAVQRLYIRHIVTQTYDIAEMILQQYLIVSSSSSSSPQPRSSNNTNSGSTSIGNNGIITTTSSSSNGDVFAALAKSISDCTYTRDDGGTVGWIERTTTTATNNNSTTTSSSSSIYDNIISNTVIQQLYQLQPKAGDIHIIEDSSASINNNINKRYHIIQVIEVWMNPEYIFTMDGNIQRTTRKQLKGKGIVPNISSKLRTYKIQTAGCQMNVADSERLESILINDMKMEKINIIPNNDDDDNDNNILITKNNNNSKNKNNKKKHKKKDENADLIILNTCSIRDHAEQKVYNTLGPYAAQKRNHNQNDHQQQQVLIVTGCVAQQEGEKLLQRIPEIDAVLGPQYIPYLSNIIEHIQAGGNQIVLTAPIFIQHDEATLSLSSSSSTSLDYMSDTALYTKPIINNHSNGRGHDVRAYVNVIYGCNEHCTYCVVPSTRGMEQSRSMESILQEIQQLDNMGYKEITLIGQNIDAYGRDMTPKRTFAQLLYYINENIRNNNSNIQRIRYVTSHPRYFSDRVIDAVMNLNKVCECFHMPFQAGDDTILKRMRRGYTYDSYLKIINKIRSSRNGDGYDAAITTDIIVGFPGETEEQFQKTLDLMEEVKFDNVNSFVYSPRPNTEAAYYHDIIPDDIKAERLQRVQQLAIKHGQERSNRYLHRIVEVLVEDINPKNPKQQVMGRTRQGRQVYFDGILRQLKGQLVRVRITQANTWSLIGEIVSE